MRLNKNLILFMTLWLVSLTALTAAEEAEMGAGLYAVIETTQGEMVFKLDYTNTPLTVTSFVGLAEDTIEREALQGRPFYDGLTFYREIENYAIFSGDPLNSGQGSVDYTLPRETNFSLTAGQGGTLVMLGLPTESDGSNFFITRGAGDAFLDNIYTPFGTLVSGEKVLNKLSVGDKITHVTIERRGTGAEAFKTDNESFRNRYQEVRTNEILELSMTEPEVAGLINSLGEFHKSMTGIYYSQTYQGYGDTPKMGNTVTVHYTGALPDGTVFDSSVSRNQAFSIIIGETSVIPGWLESILEMKTGEVRTIVIPPALAYGERGVPGAIPPNSWLIFNIQLLSIE